MPTEIIMMKTAGGALVPADSQSAEYVAKMKVGQGVSLAAKRKNNLQFHRKLYALANLAYESWEPEDKEYKGHRVEKNFEQFREDITILAGFYETSIRLDGSIRFNAKSWSFAKMDDVEKDKLYQSIITVVLKHVLVKYSREDLDSVVESILRFS